MDKDNANQEPKPEPRGFGEHSRGLSGEYAHEQGWGLNEAERRKQSRAPQDTDGGSDYNYGAQDFGDEPVNTQIAHTAAPRAQNRTTNKSTPERKETA